ncbi:MAG: GPW/gp25 family protein, partial [Saprospiraceae bacterium]
MNVNDIKSADWALATSGISQVVEGVDDINQCLAIITATKKGSDPFRPTFGSDIWDWIDRPLALALPNMKRAITEAVGTWEPRVVVTTIEH